MPLRPLPMHIRLLWLLAAFYVGLAAALVCLFVGWAI